MSSQLLHQRIISSMILQMLLKFVYQDILWVCDFHWIVANVSNFYTRIMNKVSEPYFKYFIVSVLTGGELVGSNGMTLKHYFLSLGKNKAIFSLLDFFTATWWYTWYASILIIYISLDPLIIITIFLSHQLIFKANGFVMLFIFL